MRAPRGALHAKNTFCTSPVSLEGTLATHFLHYHMYIIVFFIRSSSYKHFGGKVTGSYFLCSNVRVTGTAMSSRSTSMSGTVTSATDEFRPAKDDMYHVRIVSTRHFTVI